MRRWPGRRRVRRTSAERGASGTWSKACCARSRMPPARTRKPRGGSMEKMEQEEAKTASRAVSLTSALERELERLILSGELPPGDRINEIHLARRFGTSRGPIREATRSLEAKGLVQVVRNRGVFIRRLSIEEALEIYD